MHAQCLVAEFHSLPEAQVGLEVLENFDFMPDAVSMVSHHDEEALKTISAQQRDAEESVSPSKSAGLGALIGGTLAAPLAVGSMLGPFIVAGPLVAMAVGAAVGGLFGEAKRWGIDDESAKDLEQRVRNGSVLVIVTSTPPRLDQAEQGLKTTGPKSLHRFAVQHKP